LHATDLATFLKSLRLGVVDKPDEGWLALILDLDEGPSAPFRAGNEAFYTDDGLADLEAALRPGGVLALWSAAREPALLQRLHARLRNVAEVVVPVELDDKASLDYVYRGRRPPNPIESKKPLN
jgi:hypothetical protein